MKAVISLCVYYFILIAQSKGQNSIVRTAMPFLRIAPDARAAALGETGAATTPDLNSAYWNVAKLGFIAGNYGISGSYVPWLPQLKSGITSLYMSAFRKFDNEQTIGVALNYFTLGKLSSYDEVGNKIGQYNPNEFAIEVSYARQLSNEMGIGLTGKFLHSDVATGQNLAGSPLNAIGTVAVDVGWYYQGGRDGYRGISYGIVLNNLGPKVGQRTGSAAQFLPMNLRLGSQLHLPQNSDAINFSLDINKLLVPTSPVYKVDSLGNNTSTILRGSDPDRSIPAAIFGSFGDAPGGFKQQVKQFTIGLGVEYDFSHVFFLRGGYHYEDSSLGEMRFVTTGFGYSGETLKLDFSYAIPGGVNNPYKNTYRLTLGLTFGGK